MGWVCYHASGSHAFAKPMAWCPAIGRSCYGVCEIRGTAADVFI